MRWRSDWSIVSRTVTAAAADEKAMMKMSSRSHCDNTFWSARSERRADQAHRSGSAGRPS